MSKRKLGAIGSGTLQDGKMTWDSQHSFTNQLKAMGDGRVVCRVDFAGEKAIRSLKAHRYYQYALHYIAEFTGEDHDKLHEFYKHEFLTETIFVVNPQTGEAIERVVTKSTTKLPPEDFFDFTEKVRQHAREFFGVHVPDPDPDYARKRQRTAA